MLVRHATESSTEQRISGTEWDEAHEVEVYGGVQIVTSPGAAHSVALDGSLYVIELEDGIETEVTGLPGATGWTAATVRLRGSRVGTGTIAWPSGHIVMTAQELNTAVGEWTDFLLSSHDGATVFIHGAGVQQA